MQTLLDAWPHTAAEEQPYWKFLKTANLVLPHKQTKRNLVQLCADGSIGISFGYWNLECYPNSPPAMQDTFTRLVQQLQERCGWHFTAEQLKGYPYVKPDKWLAHTHTLIDIFNSL